MKITLWGTRGSLASCRPETVLYGGNTSCVEVTSDNRTLVILDAGTGIHRLGMNLNHDKIGKIHILLSHLHLDHILGLGFFEPLWDPKVEIHIYGPAQADYRLSELLTKYLSPPLFPVFLKDAPCRLYLHEIENSEFDIEDIHVISNFICHPGPTLGYRISSNNASMAYLSDHEPALGVKNFPISPDWTSGYNLSKNVDLLIHDSQYTIDEYKLHVGWGHSAIETALEFARLAKVKAFTTFHHDPSHSDQKLDTMLEKALINVKPDFQVYPGKEGQIFQL